MKIIRFLNPAGKVDYASAQPDGSCLQLSGDLFGDFHVTQQRAEVHKLLAPVDPRFILCIGLNYRQHAVETGAAIPEYPIVFAKSPNALQHPDEPIVLPRFLQSDEVDYECELAVVIGKTCRNVPKEQALDYVLGYTCANDVSARDWQIKRGGSQWGRGKSFDTFAPLGPWLVTGDEIPNPNTLGIKTVLNGQTVQNSNTADMIFDVPRLIEFLSGSTTLLSGTVILTGTPYGVGMASKPPRWLIPGDVVTIEIEKIGSLSNPVVAESIASN